MKIINICKPDLFDNEDLVKEYYNRLLSIHNIKNIEIYNLKDWAETSLYLYEFDCKNLNKELEKKKRHELLITAKGYDELYKNKNSQVLILDTNDNQNTFNELKQFKKDFRNEFVYNGRASYIKFLNDNEIDYLKPFDKDSLLKIKALIKSYQKELEKVPELFYLIYFNMIHFPVTKEENEYEYNILKDNTIRENNLVRRLKP